MFNDNLTFFKAAALSFSISSFSRYSDMLILRERERKGRRGKERRRRGMRDKKVQ